MENYVTELPQLPNWLTNGLFAPLMKKGSVQLSDFQWFKEEEKEDLFDVRGQF